MLAAGQFPDALLDLGFYLSCEVLLLSHAISVHETQNTSREFVGLVLLF